MEWLLLSLTFSFSLDNTVSTLTPGTTRFKEFRGHSLGGKRAEALRMTTQFYSAPRVKIRGHISPHPSQVVRVLCLHIGDANLYQYWFQGCILPKPTSVLFAVLFQESPLRRYKSYRSYSSLTRFESCIKMLLVFVRMKP